MYDAGALGAPGVGDRRSAGRSALAVRIGRRHHRTARRALPRARRDVGRRSGRRRRVAKPFAASPGSTSVVEDGDRCRASGLRAAIPRIPLGRAMTIVEPVLTYLRSRPDVEWAAPAGSLRRGQDTVGDIELVASRRRPHRGARRNESPARRRARASTGAPAALYLLIERMQVGVRLPEPAQRRRRAAPPDRIARPCDALRAYAARTRWRLTADGLFAPDGRPIDAATEEAIYAALEPALHSARDPERRRRGRGGGARRAARCWSRGATSAAISTCTRCGATAATRSRRWCRRARALGYEYMAITDHSPALGRVAEPVRRRRRRGRRTRSRGSRDAYPDITILHGCEVDILPDGRLDFPDRVLERFDIVLASLHERAGQAPEQLLRRYARRDAASAGRR